MRAFYLILAVFLTAPLGAHAGFVLDDFDDTVVVVSPEMFDIFVTTDHVGSLSANRRSRISGAQGNPDATLDANVFSNSRLTGTISNLNPLPNGETRVGIQIAYDFPSTDFGQDGANNALFFDFLSLTSELPPSLFTVRLDDDDDFYFYFDTNLQRNANPFTVTVPFESMRNRSGRAGLDATKIHFMSFSIRASTLTGGGPDPLDFFVQLERIRVGRIPEPQTLVLLMYGLCMVMVFRK